VCIRFKIRGACTPPCSFPPSPAVRLGLREWRVSQCWPTASGVWHEDGAYVGELDSRVPFHEVLNEVVRHHHRSPVPRSSAGRAHESRLGGEWAIVVVPVGELLGEDTAGHHREALVVRQRKVHDLRPAHQSQVSHAIVSASWLVERRAGTGSVAWSECRPTTAEQSRRIARAAAGASSSTAATIAGCCGEAAAVSSPPPFPSSVGIHSPGSNHVQIWRNAGFFCFFNCLHTTTPSATRITSRTRNITAHATRHTRHTL
jgi:hypothetical protein